MGGEVGVEDMGGEMGGAVGVEVLGGKVGVEVIYLGEDVGV